MGIPEESLQRLLVLRREVERAFRELLEPREPEALVDGDLFTLPLDVYESESEIVIETEIPGVRKEDLELSVLRDIIIIAGTKRRPTAGSERKHLCIERTFGAFRRIVEIPGAGDTSNISASYKDGVLRILLPKIADRRGTRRKVPID
jgi:HSP20 family protein